MGAEKRRQKQVQPEQRITTTALHLVRELLMVLVCVLIINSFVMASFEVPTGSMENTVHVGDRLFVNKFLYGGSIPYTIPLTSIRIPHFRVPGLRDIERGDVIVFDWPGDRDQVEKPTQLFYLKRCIGLPGDEVRISEKTVYVNGRSTELPPNGKFLRSYSLPAGISNPDLFPRDSAFNEDNYGPVVVPRRGLMLPISPANIAAWEVFIRREGHGVSLEDEHVLVDGRPAAQYTVERDYVFAMGDNRDNSLDSRFWGFVPVEDVIGTPMMVFWSWNPHIPIYHPIDRLLSINLGRIGTIIR